MDNSKWKTYTELMSIPDYLGRYNYLRLGGEVGLATFGSNRFLNQQFYRNPLWMRFRDDIIIRDFGCDLAWPELDIHGAIYVHHINPITIEDVLNWNEAVLLNTDNVISCSFMTHQAIHYGDERLLPIAFLTERTPNDTCPWRT